MPGVPVLVTIYKCPRCGKDFRSPLYAPPVKMEAVCRSCGAQFQNVRGSFMKDWRRSIWFFGTLYLIALFLLYDPATFPTTITPVGYYLGYLLVAFGLAGMFGYWVVGFVVGHLVYTKLETTGSRLQAGSAAVVSIVVAMLITWVIVVGAAASKRPRLMGALEAVPFCKSLAASIDPFPGRNS